MLFSEIYGTYYNAVAGILAEAVRGDLKKSDIYEIISRKAFAESAANIPQALLREEWPLVTKDMKTPLKHVPDMPLTTLQKRWLKALLADPRIRLFDVPADGLEDVRPLYTPGSIVCFDRFSDGDPYEDETYIRHFRTVLQALREKRRLLVSFTGRSGKPHRWECVPLRLEYSPRDDKFRLLTPGKDEMNIINIARITGCKLLGSFDPEEIRAPERARAYVKMELTDERNALERAMIQFSHLEKETVRLDDDRYEVTLKYREDEETELLIRILSFGPMVRVTGPDRFIGLIRERLEKQKRLGQQPECPDRKK